MIARFPFALVLLATPVAAADFASGEAIRAAISGNTVEGSMSGTGGYTEFYEASGTIKGEGYTGTWTVEGDQMCFRYGEDPATCWSVRIAGDQVTWVAGGTEEGTGTIVPGNPRGF